MTVETVNRIAIRTNKIKKFINVFTFFHYVLIINMIYIIIKIK
jgi:hypothetical protein